MTPVVVGVDPGGRTTGLAVRRAGTYIAHRLVQRAGKDQLPDATYLTAVVNHVEDLIGSAAAWIVAVDLAVDTPIVTAVEGLVTPSGHLGLIDPAGAMGAAMVLGALMVIEADFDPVVVVAPAGHGSAPLQAYPGQLVGDREPAGTGQLRHCRSAWDVAGAAPGQLRLTEAMAR